MKRREKAGEKLTGGGFTPAGGFFPAWGFTLVEVMVTMAIFGLILLVVFGAFRLGLSAWDKGEFIKEEFQKVRVSSQIISRQFKSIIPYKIKSQKADADYLAFEGKPRYVRFVSAFSLRAKQPEGLVYAIYLFREGGSEGGSLVLYEQRALNKDFMEETPPEELGVALFEGISDVRFEYYQEADLEKNVTGGWEEEWNTRDKKELPKALRMTVIPKKGQGTREEYAFTVLTPIPCYRYEAVKMTGSKGGTPQTPQPPLITPRRPPGPGA
jgi:general secretion pathway protein J